MKAMSKVTCVRQSGASIIATIIVVVLLGILLMAGLKIVPSYMDNNVIVNVMKTMEEDGSLAEMSITEIRTRLSKELLINGIRDFNTGDVVVSRTGKKESIDVNYESRVPLFYNIEAVVIFTNNFER